LTARGGPRKQPPPGPAEPTAETRETMTQIQLPDFMAITFGLVTYLLGEAINDRVTILRRFNIPDPVTGGLLVALLFFALYRLGVVEIGFDTHARDLLLLVFFTGIGLNARIAEVLGGGRPLAVLVAITTVLLLACEAPSSISVTVSQSS
jgi:ESS family glutamate:Na+ symporter